MLLNNDVVVTDGWLGQLIWPGVDGGAPTSASIQNMLLYRLRKTQVRGSRGLANGNGDVARRYSEMTDAYPGRNITVIDLCRKVMAAQIQESKI